MNLHAFTMMAIFLWQHTLKRLILKKYFLQILNPDFPVSSSVNFLFDSLMWLPILPFSTLILNFSLSGSILINLHPASSSILFFLFFFFFFFCVCLYVLFHQLLLIIWDQEGTDQFFCLKQNTVLSFLRLEMVLLLFLSLIFP